MSMVAGAASRSHTRRTFLVATGLGALLALALFLGIMQSTRQAFLDEDLLGNFYDGQAQALLDGNMNVDPKVPGFEGFRIGAQTHIYQGIVPALVRIPLLAVTDRFLGRLTGLSMILGFGTALGFLIAAAWRIRSIMRGEIQLGRAETACTAVVSFGIAGSSLLFLSSASWVYHEALIWGVALCLGSFTTLIYWLAPVGPAKASARLPPLVASLFLAGLAINTRSSIGLGPIAALGLTAVCLFVAAVAGRPEQSQVDDSVQSRPPFTQRISGWDPQRSTTRPVLSLMLILIGVTLAIVLYAGVNQARFDSWFGVPLDKQVLVDTDPARSAALEANGNSLFGLKYAPSVLLQTLRPDGLTVGSEFPFIGFPQQKPSLIGEALFAERDWSSSLPASEPLLFLAAILGVIALVVPKRFHADAQLLSLRIPVFGAAAGGSLFLAFGYISQRYLTDLFPFLALAGVIGLQAIAALLQQPQAGSEPQRSSIMRRLIPGVVVCALVLGSVWTVWVNASLALQYGLEIAPSAREAQRSRWLDLQQKLGGGVAVLRLPSGAPLPAPGPRGQVVIFGNCDALYRSSGSIWYLLEAGEAAGGLQILLKKVAPLTKPVTLLTAASPSDKVSLVLQAAGNNRAVVLVQSTGPSGTTKSAPSKQFVLLPDRQVVLRLVMTARTQTVLITEQDSGRELLREQVGLGPSVAVAQQNESVEVTIAPLATPVCERVSQ